MIRDIKDRAKREAMGAEAHAAIDLIVREAYTLHVRLERLKAFLITQGWAEEEIDRVVLGEGVEV